MKNASCGVIGCGLISKNHFKALKNAGICLLHGGIHVYWIRHGQRQIHESIRCTRIIRNC